jgi:hypothetical protein
MAAIEEVDREELGKRIDKVIEEFTRRHGRLPSKVQVLAKNGTSDLSRAVDETIASRWRSSCSPTTCGRTPG